MGIAADLKQTGDFLECSSMVEQFKKITRSYALFHFSFLALAILEIFSFLLFFSFFAKTSLLALSLAIIFMTGFSYFVLLFYFQGKKPEQLLTLKTKYLEACKKRFPAGSVEYHLFLSENLQNLVASLQNQEYSYYRLPKSFETLAPLFEKLSVWTYWKEVLKMKEMLLLDAIAQHLALVKLAPTDLQTHATLAVAFLNLAKIYRDLPEGFNSYEMQQKYKAALKRALEEFKILVHFSPEDPWVHAELASTYHELGMQDEEILEYETLLKLSPENKDVLFRLGTLYFAKGSCAQGLRIYETLKNEANPKAEVLISHYDAYLTS